jgi:serine/threonine protein phosphatase PrpC
MANSSEFSGYGEFAPASATLRVGFGVQSRCGHGRAANEDHYSIIELGRHQRTLFTSLPDGAIPARFDEHGYAMVVADGVGDAGQGELASRLAITTLMHLVVRFGEWNLRVNEETSQGIMQRASRFYRNVDSAIVQQNRSEPARPLRTTLTAVFGAGADLFFAHVGHSRAYLSRDAMLMRLTRDHTVNDKRPSRVVLAPLIDVNAAARDLRHILTDTIGMGGTIGPTIDVERVRILDHDRVLVCTNGLTDALDEDTIAEVLRSTGSPDEQCRQLVDGAIAGGGEDDVTAIVAHYRLPE